MNNKVADSYPLLLATVNCSIGNKNNHFNVKSLSNLLLTIIQKRTFNSLEKYAIGIIQTEATEQEIEYFRQEFNIPIKNIEYLLSINPYAV